MSKPYKMFDFADGDYSSPHRYAMVNHGKMYLDGLHEMTEEQVIDFGPWTRMVPETRTIYDSSRTRRSLIVDTDEYMTLMAALANLVATFPEDEIAKGHKLRAHRMAARLNEARAWRARGRSFR